VGLLFPATAAVVSALLRALGYAVHVDAASQQFAAGNFAVQFDSPCLGCERMAIAMGGLAGHFVCRSFI
jgi:hypothetical protein